MIMRIGVLAWSSNEAESVSLLEYGRSLNHHMELFTLDDIEFDLSRAPNGCMVAGEQSSRFDAILCRAEIREATFQADVERLMLLGQLTDTVMLDVPERYMHVENKALSLHTMANFGIPIVPTRLCSSLDAVAAAIWSWGNVVIKPSFGYGGHGVTRIESLTVSQAEVLRMLAIHGTLLCQPYIPHPGGDVRVTIVDSEAVLNFRRIPALGDWRANTSQGASIEPVRPTDALVELSRRAVASLGITTAGVDALEVADDEWRILEVNNTPGWALSTEEEQSSLLDAVFTMVATRIQNLMSS